MSEDSRVTKQVEDLIRQWSRANKSVQDAHRDLNSAQCERTNSQNELGKFLCPDNAKEGEKFNIWYGSSLLEVTYEGNNDYAVMWRSLSSKDMLGLT